MIEVTCQACGTAQRVSDATLPPTASTAPCRNCKAAMALPGRPARAATPPPVPKPGPPKAGGKGDVFDLGELPAPRKANPLAGAEGKTRPAKPTGLGAVLGDDLPAPVAAKKPAGGPLAGATDLDLLDLPAPVAAGGPLGLGSLGDDLPAPVAAKKKAGGPLAGATDLDLLDLPAPVAAGGPPVLGSLGDDLPAPVARKGGPLAGGNDLDLLDLPAPVAGGGPDLLDLPAPVAFGRADLPAPVTRSSPPAGSGLDLDDLLAPVPSPGSAPDLPAPRGTPGSAPNLPVPKRAGGGSVDLPAPKSPGAQLPTPKTKSAPDLPAPKGPGAQLPTPARPRAPSGMDLGPIDLPAPKAAAAAGGLFDDLGPPPPAAAPPADLFDDLLGAAPVKPPTGSMPIAQPSAGAPLAARLDLDDLDLGLGGTAPGKAPSAAPASPSKPSAPLLDLGDGGLDLPARPGAPAKASSDGDFGGLDLPSAGGATAGISFKPSEKASAAARMTSGAAGDVALDLDEGTKTDGPPAMSEKAKEAKAKADAKARAKAEEAAANDPAKRRKRMILAGVAGLVVVGLGVGGFLFYQRWDAQKQRDARATAAIADARAAMSAGDNKHWQRAASEASEALEARPGDATAKALLAQAQFAAAIDQGVDAQALLGKAKAALAEAQARGASGPDLEKAVALKAIVDDQADRAVPKLKAMGGDADAALYLGWALRAGGKHAEAIAAFDTALKLAPKRIAPATYGRAQAKLALGDLDGARADFGAVLGADKDHIGAQVGMAAAASPADLSRREGELMALLARKDIAKADPRAVALAWRLAADDARRGSRFDAARERYRKAQGLAPKDVASVVGLAEIELREGKYEVAAEAIAKALEPPPGDAVANVIAAEIDLRTKKPDAAGKRLLELKTRLDALSDPADRARYYLLLGEWYETQAGKEVDAVAAYESAIKLGPGFDLAPTIAMGRLYRRMADAVAATDPPGAAQLRGKADAALAPLDGRADADATVALTLGKVYLDTDPAKAETTLQKAVMAQLAKDLDIEARFQLAKAQAKLGKQAEALATLDGAYALDKARADIGLELALGFELAGRDAEAGRTYNDLLAGESVSIDQRGRAGRFFARTGQIALAREQGDKILALDAKHPAGLYLQGEGLIVDGKPDEAARVIQQAVDADPDPQYWDALGRAKEALGRAAGGDTKWFEQAALAYAQATEVERSRRAMAQGVPVDKVKPTMLHPLVRAAAMYIATYAYKEAIAPLTSAIELAPKHPEASYLFGMAYFKVGEKAAARQWLERAVTLQPVIELPKAGPDGRPPSAEVLARAKAQRSEINDILWQSQSILGGLYYEQNKAGPAAAALAASTRLGIDLELERGTKSKVVTDDLYLLGLLEVERGNRSAARTAWETWLARNPTDANRVDNVRRQLQTL